MTNLEKRILSLRQAGNAPTKPTVLKLLNDAKKETHMERGGKDYELAGLQALKVSPPKRGI